MKPITAKLKPVRLEVDGQTRVQGNHQVNDRARFPVRMQVRVLVRDAAFEQIWVQVNIRVRGELSQFFEDQISTIT